MKELALTLGEREKGMGCKDKLRLKKILTGSYTEKYQLLLFNLVLKLPHPKLNQLFPQHFTFILKSCCLEE